MVQSSPISSRRFSRTARIVIGLIVVACVVLAALLLSSGPLQTGSNSQSPSSGNNSGGNTIQHKAVLDVEASVSNGYWMRDATTDLPDYESTISYSVSNTGNLDATNVTISISINSNQYSSNVVSSITVYGSYSNYFSYPTPYDQTNSVLIQATCQDSTDSSSLMIGSNLPRSMPRDSEVLMLYITPKELNAVTMKTNIVKSKFFLTPDWMAIRDWVGGNIQYKFDNISHGQEDYWQLPKETLALRTGDCEDSAILLATLLRADGISASDVYVFVGTSGENGHAWVSFKWLNTLGIESWIRLEPTSGGNIIYDFFNDLGGTLQNRQCWYSFNDMYYNSYQ
jgi:hypothetical protein